LYDVVGRASSEIWKSPGWNFYINKIFIEGVLVSRPFLLLGILTLLYKIVKRLKSTEVFLILIWCVLPVLLMSFCKTKAFWYIACSFPAITIITGVGFKTSLNVLYANSCRRNVSISSTLALLIFLLGVSDTISQSYSVLSKVVSEQVRIPFEDLAIFVEKNLSIDSDKVIVFGGGLLEFDELPYRNMIKKFGKVVFSRSEVIKTYKKTPPEKNLYVLGPQATLDRLEAFKKVKILYTLPPRGLRNKALFFAKLYS
jgi:hypothetical protein